MELAFQLSPWGQKHTSPSLLKELQSLLTLYKDEELHKFVSGQLFGHISHNPIPPGLDPNVEASFEDYVFDSEESLSPDDLSNQKRQSGKANGVYVNEDGQLVDEWDANINGLKTDNDNESWDL